jgi:histone H3/H4
MRFFSTHPDWCLEQKSRLIREVCQEKVPRGHDIRFTTNSLKAIQEASEMFIVETFHKSDLARAHTGRETLSVKDIRFSRFMKPESMWVMSDRMHEKEFFGTVPLSSTNPAKLKLREEEAAFGKDVSAIEKKLKKKAAATAAAATTGEKDEPAAEADSRKKRKAAGEEEASAGEQATEPTTAAAAAAAAAEEESAKKKQKKEKKDKKAPVAADAAPVLEEAPVATTADAEDEKQGENDDDEDE